jgi:glycosyltransferase involved in cell wall biosynthesis
MPDWRRPHEEDAPKTGGTDRHSGRPEEHADPESHADMVKRRRLLAVVSTTARSSPLRLIFDVLAGLPPDDYEITVCSLSSDPPDNLRPEFEERGIRCHSLRLDGWRRWWPGNRVEDHLRRERPDILYCSGLRPALFGGAAGHAVGVPARVETLCNIPHEDYRNLYGRVLGSVAWRLHRRAQRRFFHRVVPLATRMGELLLEQGLPDERVEVILSGGDFPGFTPPTDEERRQARARIFGEENDPGLVAAFVGELHSPKGIFDLVPAAAEVQRRGVLASWLFLGEPTEGEELSRLAVARGIRSRIHLLGALDDVPATLAAADLFVHASHTEGLSRALLEAMAMGLPPVVTDVSGSRDVIPDPSLGIVVPVEDPEAFAEAVLELAASVERRTKMGKRARERVVEHFSAPRMAAEYHALFTSLLEENSGKGPAAERS